MPHTRSAKKNLRKSEKHRQHNKSVQRAVKTQIKKFMDTAQSGTLEQLREEFRTTTKKLDKAAARRIIHRNLASRKKSQLARVLQAKASAPKPAAAAKPAPKK
jgi:small subunit ribosomal protein S20